MASGYLYGNKYDPSTGQGGGTPYVIGRVKSVVMGPYIGSGLTKTADPEYSGPSDIGKIKYEILYSSLGTSNSNDVSEPAYPIFDFIKQLPLKNEIVLMVPGPTEKLNDRASRQQLFYFPPFSIWNKVNHSAFPNMQEYANFRNQSVNEPEYQGSATTGSQSIPLGRTFEEKSNIRNLRPFEGDTILQGRFGQSFRMGSTVMDDLGRLRGIGIKNPWSKSGVNGDPITIILNKQGKRIDPAYVDMAEDINKDGSSIYMTSTQEIFLEDVINFPLKSFGTAIEIGVQPVIEVRTLPTSNEVISAAEQDNLSIKNK